MNDRYEKIEWAKMTNGEIARKLGMTKEGVGAARKRLGAPPSPAGWGGYRWGAHSTAWYLQQVRALSRGLMHGQLEQLLKAVLAAKRKSPGAASSPAGHGGYLAGVHSTDWYREQIRELIRGLDHGQLEKLVKLARSFSKK